MTLAFHRDIIIIVVTRYQQEGKRMAIIRQYHKDTDTTYVYESTSYWDAEKGQSRSKRRCIGKVDPETGEVIPTRKRGDKKRDAAAQTDQETAKLNSQVITLKKELAEQASAMRDLTDRLNAADAENRKLRKALEDILVKAESLVRKS